MSEFNEKYDELEERFAGVWSEQENIDGFIPWLPDEDYDEDYEDGMEFMGLTGEDGEQGISNSYWEQIERGL